MCAPSFVRKAIVKSPLNPSSGHPRFTPFHLNVECSYAIIVYASSLEGNALRLYDLQTMHLQELSSTGGAMLAELPAPLNREVASSSAGGAQLPHDQLPSPAADSSRSHSNGAETPTDLRRLLGSDSYADGGPTLRSYKLRCGNKALTLYFWITSPATIQHRCDRSCCCIQSTE